MDEHVGPTSPDQSAPPPTSYSRDQKPTWNIFGKLFALFSNRTTAIAGILVLVLGVGAGIVAVQRSTETRQHAAAIVSPQGPCYPFGDVNVNGKVDAVDAQLVLKYVGGITISGNFNQKNADVDADGRITSGDALKIQRYIVGLDPTLPACKAPSPKPTITLIPTMIPEGKLPPCYLSASIITKLGLPTNTSRGYGDVDGNGKINEYDARETSNFIGKLTIFTPLQVELADVDGAPGVVSIASDVHAMDVSSIQRYIVNMQPTFPACGPTTPTPSKAPTPTPPMISPWSASPIPTK